MVNVISTTHSRWVPSETLTVGSFSVFTTQRHLSLFVTHYELRSRIVYIRWDVHHILHQQVTLFSVLVHVLCTVINIFPIRTALPPYATTKPVNPSNGSSPNDNDRW